MKETYWSRFPESYDWNQEYVVGKELLTLINQELRELADLGDVLELGCGTGYFTVTIAEKSQSLLATDLSDTLLAVAETRMRDYPDVTFQKENCMNTSFAAKSFDSVFMANIIHVIEDPPKMLQECHRVLRSSGRIVIVTFTGHGMSLWQKIIMGFRFARAWGKPPPLVHSFTPEDVASMLKDAGFVILQSKLIGKSTKALFLVGTKS